MIQIETFQHLKIFEFHENETKKSIFSCKREEQIKVNGYEIITTTEHTYLGKIMEEEVK